MKTAIYNKILGTAMASLLLITSCVLTSCDDELEIVPKGKTTLENVDDLDALLNTEYSLGAFLDLSILCNEALGQFTPVSACLSQKNTVDYANMTYDESINRAELAATDARIDATYKYINYMNVIISKAPDAKGDNVKRERIIAEAKILRAYFHWLMVNIYAKQYDEATAETDGGVPYVTNTDVSKVKEKVSVAEVYRNILEDCSDENISKLVDQIDDVERVDKAFGNAVRAKVLMQMKRYSEALPYAQASIRYNGLIADRSTIKTTKNWSLTQSMETNIIYMGAGSRACPTYITLSIESSQLFEEGDYVVKYDRAGWKQSLTNKEIIGALQFRKFGTMSNVFGITSDRMYYTAAECLIRTGKIKEGLEYVDKVRAYRVENYEPFAKDGLTEQQAMALMQRAKWIECVATYENFFDTKRWNTEANYRKTITRNLCEYGTYSISPDSPLWILPFPLSATRYNSTLTQNY